MLLLKSWSGKVKCLSAGKAFGRFFDHSNGYWRQSHFYQDIGHDINHTQVNVLHIYFCSWYYGRFYISIWSNYFWRTQQIWLVCMSQRVLVIGKPEEHLLLSLLLDLISFLLYSVVLLLILCLRYVFLWNAISDDNWNIDLEPGLICKTCQFFQLLI